MPSATRTMMGITAIVPLLLLSAAHAHLAHGGDPARATSTPSEVAIPDDCYMISDFIYGSDAPGVPDLDTAQSELATWAVTMDSSLSEHDKQSPNDLHDRAQAVHALAQPDARRSGDSEIRYITAYNSLGQMVAQAAYGRPGEVYWKPTPGHGYLLMGLTYAIEPQPGQTNCTASK